ncbi:hypothetical protein NKG05_04115 [Oerskovia sp. M15]
MPGRHRARQSYELTGPMAVSMARSLWLDALVLGMVGIDAAAGLTCGDPDEAGVTSALVEHSRHVIAVGTSDKLGERSFAQICDISRITTLVTDSGRPRNSSHHCGMPVSRSSSSRRRPRTSRLTRPHHDGRRASR